MRRTLLCQLLSLSLVASGCGSGAPDAAPGTGVDAVSLQDLSPADTPGEDLPGPDGVDVSLDGAPSEVVEGPPEWWGEPIDAPADTWTWVPFPETHCADGSPTGIGVNLHPGATRVLLYLEGGGACWDYGTCFGIATTSFHLGGYDEGSFSSLFTEVYKSLLFFNRESDKSPMPDAHYVFVPYCTGDVHSGDAVVDLEGLLPWEKETIHFKGHHNMERYLSRLAPTFAEADRVVVAGASAGGFGTLLSWPTIKEAFPHQRVDIIDDSGPPIAFSEETWAQWRDTWNIQMPDGCPECDQSIGVALDYALAELLPGGRFALISYNQDTIISTFLGLLPSAFKDLLGDLCEILDTEDSAQYFVLSGLAHTPTIFVAGTAKASDGTPLWQWLQQMQDDDEEWVSHKP